MFFKTRQEKRDENNTDYKKGVRELQEAWWKIKAIVCDWRKWLLWWFPDIPTQMCNFSSSSYNQKIYNEKNLHYTRTKFLNR